MDLLVLFYRMLAAQEVPVQHLTVIQQTPPVSGPCTHLPSIWMPALSLLPPNHLLSLHIQTQPPPPAAAAALLLPPAVADAGYDDPRMQGRLCFHVKDMQHLTHFAALETLAITPTNASTATQTTTATSSSSSADCYAVIAGAMPLLVGLPSLKELTLGLYVGPADTEADVARVRYTACRMEYNELEGHRDSCRSCDGCGGFSTHLNST